MKYKKLTKEQIIISLDRLTRFKPTKEKYIRVFYDIILSNLIDPKLRKSDLEKMDLSEIKNYVEEIFDNSLESCATNFEINKKLKEYENSIFNNDEETQILLDNNINYLALMKYINDTDILNLRWLLALSRDVDVIQARMEYALKFPIEKVILVEGLTEEILLPVFSKFLNLDFAKHGVQVIGAGGKNQVVKMYYRLSQELKLPIFLLLDRDAEDNIQQIMPRLRNIDKIHPVSCGEFEDLLPKPLIIKTVNQHFANFLTITENDFDDVLPRAKALAELFKTKGLHAFKKAEFAKLVSENICGQDDVSPEIKDIINEVFV